MFSRNGDSMFRAGFVSIIGRPNVGKSTLLNRLTGEKIAIMSSRPQTTRNVIRAIVTDDDSQIVFLDTPGMHVPKTKLGNYMVSSARGAVKDVDAIVVVIEAGDVNFSKMNSDVIEALGNTRKPVFLVINKIDLFEPENILKVISAYKDLYDFKEIIPISAAKGDGVDLLLNELKNVMPEGDVLFDPEYITDQPERVICQEIIREKILISTNDEVPHGTGVEVISFKERESGFINIDANIYCEKESHKAILIGKKGSMIKKIGIMARKDIENLLQTEVCLKLWIKVKPDWRNKDSVLKTLGYN